MDGVAFKKTFSYAGFEMQPKRYDNPKIALLNVELELKAEKDNAEVRVKSVEVRPQVHGDTCTLTWYTYVGPAHTGLQTLHIVGGKCYIL